MGGLEGLTMWEYEVEGKDSGPVSPVDPRCPDCGQSEMYDGQCTLDIRGSVCSVCHICHVCLCHFVA